MAKINAKSIESQAQHISRHYNKQAQLKSLAQGIKKGQRTASTAARGGTLGYGSTRDVAVSQEVLDEIDRLTINVNKVLIILIVVLLITDPQHFKISKKSSTLR